MRKPRPLRGMVSAKKTCLIGMALLGPLTLAAPLRAEQRLHDPALPTGIERIPSPVGGWSNPPTDNGGSSIALPGTMRVSLSDDRFVGAIVQRTP
jgi:hypothetical protein